MPQYVVLFSPTGTLEGSTTNSLFAPMCTSVANIGLSEDASMAFYRYISMMMIFDIGK